MNLDTFSAKWTKKIEYANEQMKAARNAALDEAARICEEAGCVCSGAIRQTMAECGEHKTWCPISLKEGIEKLRGG